jgi:hypothetical protein
MFKQQVIGTINLSIPLIILYQFYPILLVSVAGRLFCAAVIGSYIYYLNRNALLTMVRTLTFVPTHRHKKEFEDLITECNLNPQNINLHYSYTNKQTALAALNSVVVDPLIWSMVDEDPQAKQVKDIVTPMLANAFKDKAYVEEAKQVFSTAAQRFVFKHELGHIFHNYSSKKLTIIWLIGTSSAFMGMTAAVNFLHWGGMAALLVGLVTGGVIDLMLTYISNFFFKVQEEKKADFFAARYCSREEIDAAADFFEKNQHIIDAHFSESIMHKLPSTIVSGHPTIPARVHYLRQLAAQK